MEKQCTKCNKTKDISEFRINTKYKDGYTTYCNSCLNEYASKYRNNNKIYFKKYRKENRSKLIEKNKKWKEENNWKNNPETWKKYYKKNKEKLIKIKTEYFKTDNGKLVILKYKLKRAKKEKTKQKLLQQITELQKKINNN